MAVFVRPFEKADLDAFEPLEPMTKSEQFSPEFAQAIEDSDLSVTGVRNGKVIGCGGVHPLDNDQGEIWLRLSKDCLKHKLDTLRWLRDGLKIIEKIFPFRQLNVLIKDSFARSVRLAESLGFCKVQIITHENKKWFLLAKRVKE